LVRQSSHGGGGSSGDTAPPPAKAASLAPHSTWATAKTGHEKQALQRQIDATDRQIDRLLYDLYGLTEEEIGIVEE
jgi:hypothetical protein